MKHLFSFFIFFSTFYSLALSVEYHNIVKVSNDVGSDLNFNFLDAFDFDLDGTLDKVHCTKDHFVKITSGRNSKVIYSWKGDKKLKYLRSSKTATRKKVVSGCEIVEMPDGRPMILLSNFWDTFRNGRHFWRANALQWIIFHDGRKYRRQAVLIDSKTKYKGVTRSIKCSTYPKKLVNRGHKPGALCFFADYASDNTNRTVLLKFEYSRDKRSINTKDFTANIKYEFPYNRSAAIWSGGVRGTSIYSLPLGVGWSTNQRDGAFMMDSAFLDFNSDGLVDLMTAGQHASLRVHRMRLRDDQPGGFIYETTALTRANKFSEATEFMRLSSFQKFSGRGISGGNPCVYVGVENTNKNQRDHVRCFLKRRWVSFDFPQKFASVYARASVLKNRDGIIIKTKRKKRNGGYRPLTFFAQWGRPVVPEGGIPLD